MATSSNAAARAREIQQRDQAARAETAPIDDPQVPEAQEPPPVRQTVDVTYARHVKLAEWRQETAVALGWKRLGNQDVLDAMIGFLLEDETFARRLRTRIADPTKDPSPTRRKRKT